MDHLIARARRRATDPASLARARSELRARLETCREEIEQAALDRAHGIADPAEVPDPAYAQGLRATVSAAIDYALEVLEAGEERAPEPPPALLSQARLAARSGVPLQTVLRRYFAGYMLLAEFLAREGEAAAPARLLPGRGAVLDRLLAALAAEYEREEERRRRTSAQRRAERIERLLAGERIDTSEIPYDLEGCHLGLVAADRQAQEAIRDLAAELDARTLLVAREEGPLWAWLGTRRPLDAERALRSLSSASGPLPAVAIGEPAEGRAGWCLTHRQAAAALSVAEREGKGVARYADVALLAAVLRDELLVASLRRVYLEPLERERDRGESLRRTLRAYFASGQNVSSTATALRVDRKTVTARLRAVERHLGRPLSACAAEMEIALALQGAEAPERHELRSS